MEPQRPEGSRPTPSAAALQGQIHPHFFFNALTTILGFVRARPLLAEELIAGLACYSREVLNRRGPVFLAEELALVQLYLALERARLGVRLRTIFDLDPMALGATVPALLVQPLVENAVLHGAAQRIDGATVRLAVRYRPRWQRLLIMVADDGPGIARAPSLGRLAGENPPRVIAGVADESAHLGGLRNVAQRLAALYGAGARLRLMRRYGGGTIAVLALPVPARSFRRPPRRAEGGGAEAGVFPWCAR